MQATFKFKLLFLLLFMHTFSKMTSLFQFNVNHPTDVRDPAWFEHKHFLWARMTAASSVESGAQMCDLGWSDAGSTDRLSLKKLQRVILNGCKIVGG